MYGTSLPETSQGHWFSQEHVGLDSKVPKISENYAAFVINHRVFGNHSGTLGRKIIYVNQRVKKHAGFQSFLIANALKFNNECNSLFYIGNIFYKGA